MDLCRNYGPHLVVESVDSASAWFVAGCCHASFLVLGTFLKASSTDPDSYSVYVITPKWNLKRLRRKILNRRKIIGNVDMVEIPDDIE